MKTNKITHDPRFSLAALASASLIVLGLGCATTAPSDHLVDARDHYDIARNGVAGYVVVELRRLGVDPRERVDGRPPRRPSARHVGLRLLDE